MKKVKELGEEEEGMYRLQSACFAVNLGQAFQGESACRGFLFCMVIQSTSCPRESPYAKSNQDTRQEQMIHTWSSALEQRCGIRQEAVNAVSL